MGMYVNPQDMSKEQWLKVNGKQVAGPTVVLAEGQALVCLVDNGPFRAAGVAFSQREKEAFMLPHDVRPKTWYVCQVADLEKLPGLEDLRKAMAK